MEHAKQILQVFEPGIDGAFRHVEGLVHYLISSGQCVHLAYSSRRDSEQLYKLVELVHQNGGQTVDLEVGPKPAAGDLVALARLIRFARSVSADLLHAHSSKAGVLARMAAKWLSVPCFYTPHAYYGMTDAPGLQKKLFCAVEKSLAGWAHTLNVSEEEGKYAEQTLKVPAERRTLIRNGVSFDRFCPADKEKKACLRKAMGLPENAKILCSVARFSYQKNPQQTYEVFQRLAEQYEDVFLAHVGNGDLRTEVAPIVAALKGRVKTFDFMANPAELYQASDGFILTSRYEGMPLSVLEALATNLPIILTDVPGNQSFASIGLDQLYYGRTSDELLACLRRWRESLNDAQLPNHRAMARPMFSHEVSYGAITQLYESTHPAAKPIPAD